MTIRCSLKEKKIITQILQELKIHIKTHIKFELEEQYKFHKFSRMFLLDLALKITNQAIMKTKMKLEIKNIRDITKNCYFFESDRNSSLRFIIPLTLPVSVKFYKLHLHKLGIILKSSTLSHLILFSLLTLQYVLKLDDKYWIGKVKEEINNY